LIEIGSKTAEKNSAQTKRQTDYENNGHLAVNQQIRKQLCTFHSKLTSAPKTTMPKSSIMLNNYDAYGFEKNCKSRHVSHITYF